MTPPTLPSPLAPSFAVRQRARLADALLQAGPQAPTLCEGWTARDLAVHLVVREHRPDTALTVVAPLAARAERVRAAVAEQPFADLVARFRAGPPRLSPLAVGAVDRLANSAEYFVHAEDVLRAAPGAEPQTLSAADQETLWQLATSLPGRWLYRRSPVGVVLVSADGPRRVVRRGRDAVALTGDPAELVLYGFGRTAHAEVALDGRPETVGLFRGARLGV